jgi:hypothetical protein
VHAGHRCLETAAGEATAVDAARFWQESTIEPVFAATADMIAASLTASCSWPSVSPDGAISPRSATQPAIRQISDEVAAGFTLDNADSHGQSAESRPCLPASPCPVTGQDEKGIATTDTLGRPPMAGDNYDEQYASTIRHCRKLHPRHRGCDER